MTPSIGELALFRFYPTFGMLPPEWTPHIETNTGKEMLEAEIESTQRNVRTDAYQMSIGELTGMYERAELLIRPEFQRLFRWDIGQKSKLIESLLLGIPLPSIFVFETDDGTWELIDGLQRLSTILEFMGILKDDQGVLKPPSILEATKYLPSLHNAVWDESNAVIDVPVHDQVSIGRSLQLAIKRSRLGVEILKRPSDNDTKYDLFQRLNAGGTLANAQELRNCIVLMVNADFFRALRASSERQNVRDVINLNEEQIEKQRHVEYATRLIVHTLAPYDGTLDVEAYIDAGIVSLASSYDPLRASNLIDRTFDLLHQAMGGDALRLWDGTRHVGRVGLVALEGIAVGVAKNIEAISSLTDPAEFVRNRIKSFWLDSEISTFRSPGLRGTRRIQLTVPFGINHFRP